jgi:hypothetical protein
MRNWNMEDGRIWEFEESLWTGDAEQYRALIDDECVMVLPEQPFVLTGHDAIEAVANTPRWSGVTFTERQVMRPQEGLISIAYKAEPTRQGCGIHSLLYDDDAASRARRVARHPASADAASCSPQRMRRYGGA